MTLLRCFLTPPILSLFLCALWPMLPTPSGMNVLSSLLCICLSKIPPAFKAQNEHQLLHCLLASFSIFMMPVIVCLLLQSLSKINSQALFFLSSVSSYCYQQLIFLFVLSLLFDQNVLKGRNSIYLVNFFILVLKLQISTHHLVLTLIHCFYFLLSRSLQ